MGPGIHFSGEHGDFAYFGQQLQDSAGHYMFVPGYSIIEYVSPAPDVNTNGEPAEMTQGWAVDQIGWNRANQPWDMLINIQNFQVSKDGVCFDLSTTTLHLGIAFLGIVGIWDIVVRP